MKKILPKINSQSLPKTSLADEINARWNPCLRAADDTNNTITIYQHIGEDFFGEGFTARRMSAALRSIGPKADVVVSINSPGGDFFEGATIYNLLREHEGHVTVKIPGLAASAASVIAMAGDTIQISDAGFLMIHNSWGMVVGNRNDMNQAADTFKIFDEAMADVYAARTGLDKKQISKMMDADTWMNAAMAVENGFADESTGVKAIDEINSEKKAKAMARRTIETALAKIGVSRKDRDDLLHKAYGVRDAADVVRDADGWDELLKTLKT
jgi:ATP-dependent protease ClpP protease subunit